MRTFLSIEVTPVRGSTCLIKLRTIMAGLLGVAVICGISTEPSLAEDLNGQGIKSAISGKRVVLSSVGFEFPLFYNDNGRVTGDGSAVGLSKFFAPKETGNWWIADNKLCQKFPTWYKGQTFCFTLQMTGANNLSWQRNDGYSGSAKISG
jgi:hypothetical protein